MKKILSLIVVVVATMACLMIVINYVSFDSQAQSSDTDVVNLELNIDDTLVFSISSGSSVAFDNLFPGVPECAATASVASVTTNAVNGYTLGVHDGSATNSALSLGGLGVTYITDYAGTIGTPTTWTGTGLGVTMWAADTNKEVKWGTGTTVCDANNSYAGIPETATTAHTVTGFRSGADTSSWGWKVDVPASQTTGNYTGTVTFTATTVIS